MQRQSIGNPPYCRIECKRSYRNSVSSVSRLLQLRVAVLLDDEDALVLLEELVDLLAERERSDAAVVDVDAALGEPVERLA